MQNTTTESCAASFPHVCTLGAGGWAVALLQGGPSTCWWYGHFLPHPAALGLAPLLPGHSSLPPSCFALTLSPFPQSSHSLSFQHGGLPQEVLGPTRGA